MAKPKSKSKGLRLRGDVWSYDFKHEGKRYTGSTDHTSITKAEAWLRVYRTRIEDEARETKIGRAPITDMTVRELFAKWKSVHRGPGAERLVDSWEPHILPLIGDMRAVDVGTFQAEEIRAEYLKGMSRVNAHLEREGSDYVRPEKTRSTNGANKLMTQLKTIFNWAIKGKLLPYTFAKPSKLTEQTPVKHFLRSEQVDAFLAVIDKPHRFLRNPPPNYGLHLSVMVRCMLFLALREDEARHMRWSGFNSDMTTYQPWDTKTGATVGEPCPVPPTLRALIELLPREGEWVLPGEDGNPHFKQYTAKAIKRASLALGVLGISPHRMRGSAATIAARAGANAFTVQALGNWKRIETAMKYVEVTREDVLEAQRRAFPGK